MTAKRILFFACVLFLLLALKHAFGQDNVVGWEPEAYQDPLNDIFGLMLGAPILGSVFGVLRVLAGRTAPPVLQPIRLK